MVFSHSNGLKCPSRRHPPPPAARAGGFRQTNRWAELIDVLTRRRRRRRKASPFLSLPRGSAALRCRLLWYDGAGGLLWRTWWGGARAGYHPEVHEGQSLAFCRVSTGEAEWIGTVECCRRAPFRARAPGRGGFLSRRILFLRYGGDVRGALFHAPSAVKYSKPFCPKCTMRPAFADRSEGSGG